MRKVIKKPKADPRFQELEARIAGLEEYKRIQSGRVVIDTDFIRGVRKIERAAVDTDQRIEKLEVAVTELANIRKVLLAIATISTSVIQE